MKPPRGKGKGTPRTGSGLLSDHGEGYCPSCRFIQGLTPDGKLRWHQSSEHSLQCPGSLTEPPAEIPYSSEEDRFRVERDKPPCPVCKRKVYLTPSGRPEQHTPSPYALQLCPGGEGKG